MDREFLDRLSPPKPNRRRRKVTPRELDEEINKHLEGSQYFEWDKAQDSTLGAPEILKDEISFKPINAGLGFHPSEKSLPRKAVSLGESRDSGLWEKPKYFSFEDAKKKTFEDTSLQPFYEPSHEASLEKIFSRTQQTRADRELEVKSWERLSAWGVDFIIVACISLLNLWLMFTISEVSLNFNNFDLESYVLSASLFGFWYLMYFTVGDFIGATFGKKLLNIEVLNMQKSAVDFSQSLLRSFFSLISLFTLGLFSLFDGPSIGSKTQVCRRGKTNS